jgi:hypothetical protein
VGGDTLVQASEVKNGVNVNLAFIIPVPFSGVNAQAGVGTDDTGDLLTNLQGAATTAALNKVQSFVSSNSNNQQQAGQKTQGQAPSFHQPRRGIARRRQFHG